MIYAVISDIHANEHALRRVLDDAVSAGAERIVCLGDIVGYGPMPREALALLRRHAAVVIAGNHDDAVSGRQGADDFIDLAGEAVSRHREALSRTELDYLRALPYECEFAGARATHGDFTDPKAFNYVEKEEDAAACFQATSAALLFVGHTHTPEIFVTGQSGSVYRLDAQDFKIEPGKRYLVNPGSVGYPRAEDGRCFSSYILYDSDKQTITYRRLPFSVASMMQRGGAPRRWMWITIATATAVAAAVGATILYKAAHPPRVQLVKVETGRPETQLPAIASKSLTLGRGSRYVRANLTLDKRSAAILLQIEFKSANGERLDFKQRTVVNSAREHIKVPANAISAHFTLRKLQPSDNPIPLTFAPSISTK